MLRTLLLSASLAVLSACGGSGDGAPRSDAPDATVAQVFPDMDSVAFQHEASDLPVDEDVVYGVLPNGLRYAVQQNGTPSNTATLLMRIDAGSLDETDDTRGLAHFLEHMAFNGSENIPEGEMVKRLERLGLSFGADTNASTSFEETVYQLELPEVSDALLDEALMIFRETADRLTLDPEAIERERGVIEAERRARNSAGFRAAVDSLAFQTEPAGLADRLPIGTPETVATVTPEQFEAFYRGQYRPEDTFVVLVGDRPVEQLAQKIEAAFGDWQAVGEPADDAEVEGYGFDTPRAAAFFDPEITPRLTLSVYPGAMSDDEVRDTKANRAEALPYWLATALLNRRYSQLVSAGEAEFTGAGVSWSTTYGNSETASLGVNAEHENLRPAFIQAERELRRALDHGFSQTELDEQIANWRTYYENAVTSAETRRTPSIARGILSTFSSRNVLTSAETDLAVFEESVKDVDLGAVEAALRDAFRTLDTAPQLYLQSDTVIEDAEDWLFATLQESRAESLPPLADKEATTFAYTDWGTPGTVAERGRIDDLDMTTVRFDNNVRLTMKKTDYEKDRIRVRVRAGAGAGQFDPADQAFPTQLSAILARSALGQHDADQLRSAMTGKTVSSGRGFGPEAMTLSGTTKAEDLLLQFQLMAAQLTDPGFREEVVGNFQKQIRQVWSKADSTPGGAANIYIAPILTQNHPTSRHPSEEEMVDIDLDELRTWYETRVTDGAIEIAVVGDFDEQAVIDAVAATFGTLPERPDPVVDIRPDQLDTPLAKPQARAHTVTHRGEPDTALVRVYWPIPNHEDVQTDREIGMLASVLRLALQQTLREDEGVTYTASAYSIRPEHRPDWGYVVANIEANPEEVDRVTALIEETVAELASEGVTDDMFDRAIKPVLENFETSLENNGFWLGLADEAQSDPSTLDDYRSRDAAYQNMTAADVSGWAKRVFDPSQATRVHVLPEG